MGDRDGKVEPVPIRMIPGKVAPRFDVHTTELTPQHVVITERGMQSGLPMVDMIFADPSGKRFGYTTSGRMAIMLGAAVQGVICKQGREPDYVPVIIQALEGKHEQSDWMQGAANALADAIGERVACESSEALREAVRLSLIELLRK